MKNIKIATNRSRGSFLQNLCKQIESTIILIILKSHKTVQLSNNSLKYNFRLFSTLPHHLSISRSAPAHMYILYKCPYTQAHGVPALCLLGIDCYRVLCIVAAVRLANNVNLNKSHFESNLKPRVRVLLRP